jgi:hypothetical protein
VKNLFVPEVATALSAAIRDLNKLGIIPIITDGFRTPEDQLNRDSVEISLHQAGFAIDISPRSSRFGTIVNVLMSEPYGFKWGGDFINKDPVHFYQNPFGTPRTVGYFTGLSYDVSVKLNFYNYCQGRGQ